MKFSWDFPSPRLQLSGKDLHIWQAGLDLPGTSFNKVKEVISPDERMRSENFHFERDRNRFIVAHGTLRLILGCYLGIAPDVIRFSHYKNGKPGLLNDVGETGIQFNLSHSQGLALFAFSRCCEVGVDVEYMREFPDMEQVVDQFFSVGERDFFGTLPESEKHETFFTWWTRKEAFIKAVGEGLSYPLDRFDVLSAGEISAGSSEISGDAKKGPEWSMWDVSPAEGYAAAVVVEGDRPDVRYFQWPGYI